MQRTKKGDEFFYAVLALTADLWYKNYGVCHKFVISEHHI
jgi:hypothetical protein